MHMCDIKRSIIEQHVLDRADAPLPSVAASNTAKFIRQEVRKVF